MPESVPPEAAAPVLTIDGPSGSGKGTISRRVAAALGWHYLDSGALYRAVGVAAGWADLDLADPAALVRCAFDTRIGFEERGDGEGPQPEWLRLALSKEGYRVAELLPPEPAPPPD